jgi:hypothetical protein
LVVVVERSVVPAGVSVVVVVLDEVVEGTVSTTGAGVVSTTGGVVDDSSVLWYEKHPVDPMNDASANDAIKMLDFFMMTPFLLRVVARERAFCGI